MDSVIFFFPSNNFSLHITILCRYLQDYEILIQKFMHEKIVIFNTAEHRYNMVQYNTILHKAQQWQMAEMDVTLNSQ